MLVWTLYVPYRFQVIFRSQTTSHSKLSILTSSVLSRYTNFSILTPVHTAQCTILNCNLYLIDQQRSTMYCIFSAAVTGVRQVFILQIKGHLNFYTVKYNSNDMYTKRLIRSKIVYKTGSLKNNWDKKGAGTSEQLGVCVSEHYRTRQRIGMTYRQYIALWGGIGDELRDSRALLKRPHKFPSIPSATTNDDEVSSYIS